MAQWIIVSPTITYLYGQKYIQKWVIKEKRQKQNVPERPTPDCCVYTNNSSVFRKNAIER